jgi:uncharacterized protein (DUF58 family)
MVRITSTGVSVAASALTLLVGGIAADYPELVILGSASAAALVIGLLWMLARPQLTADRQISPERVSVGGRAEAVLTVTNKAARRTLPLAIKDGEKPIALPSIAARMHYTTSYPLPTSRRGRFVLPPLSIGHTDPLRLLRTNQTMGTESVFYVHPKVFPVAPIPSGGPKDNEGPTSSTSPQGGMAFHSMREYVPGDDWRLIHWKSTARTGRVLVRHNVIPDEPRHLVVLDTNSSAYRGDSFDDAVSVAASLCAAAGQAQYPVELRTTSAMTMPGNDPIDRWTGDATPALDQLASVQADSDDSGLSALVNVATEVVSGDEGVVLGIVTGDITAADLQTIRVIRNRFLRISIVQIGRRADWLAATPSGVTAMSARSAEEFAAKWNQLVPV